MILNQGFYDLVEDAHDLMTKGQGGTDATLFDKSQTGLQTAVAASNVNLSDKTFSKTAISVTQLLDTSTANSNTFVEFEVNDGTNSFNRAVKAAVSKVDTMQLNVITTFDFVVIS